VFPFPDASKHLHSPIYLATPSRKVTGASIDSRTLRSGDLFVALPGRSVDGHDFLREAFRAGASGAVISKNYFDSQRDQLLAHAGRYCNLIPVDQPFEALTALARWHRNHFNFPVIAITGSVGKTTTKDFLYFLLRQNKSGIATRVNQNNHLGIPLTLLNLNDSHEFCVCEVGVSQPDEMKPLASLVKPTAGLLTRVSAAHLEGFGSLGKIYETKLDLFRSLKPESIAVVPGDDLTLLGKLKKFPLKIISVGYSKHCDYRISKVLMKGGRVFFCVNGVTGARTFSFPGNAVFFALNAGLAIAMAEGLGEKMENMPVSWDQVGLPPGRFQTRSTLPGITVIDDTYNASPISFTEALAAFDAMRVSGRRVLAFADMLELGDKALECHQSLGQEIGKHQLDCVVGYGELSKESLRFVTRTNPDTLTQHFSNDAEVSYFLQKYLKDGDALLLKGSRSMEVEKVLASLKRAVPICDSGLESTPR